MTRRLAAGAGVVSAFLLLSVPAMAPSEADPGHRNDRGSSEHRGGGHGQGQSKGNPANRRGNDNRPRDVGNGPRRGATNNEKAFGGDRGPQVRVGSGRDSQEIVRAPGPQLTSPPTSNSVARASVDEAPPVSSAASSSVVADPGSGGSGSGVTGGSGPTDSSGVTQQAVPNALSSGPRVTFGNGRVPGGSPDSELPPAWDVPVWQPVPAPPLPPPPPPLPPPPPPSWVERIATPPATTTQFGAVSTTDWSGAWWGVVGLLLIPAAGAALGYRQARAAQAVDRIRQG